MKKYFHLLLATILSSGCATWKKETLAYMGGSLVAGGIVGAAQAPEGDNAAMHGALWGGLTAAAVGAALVYLQDDDSRIREKDMEIQTLRMELSANGGRQKIDSGESQFFEKSLPEGVSDLIKPGEWYLYEIDEWKKTAQGEFVHQDKLLEFKPPKVKIK